MHGLVRVCVRIVCCVHYSIAHLFILRQRQQRENSVFSPFHVKMCVFPSSFFSFVSNVFVLRYDQQTVDLNVTMFGA